MTTVRIRRGGTDDIPAILALLDGAVAWLAAQGRTGQWAPGRGRPDRAAWRSSSAM
jgi:hypothetical protein